MQQISRREILLGDQIQNMLAWIAAGSLIVFAQRKCVVFRKEWYRKTGKEVMEGRPLLHRLLGFKCRCKGCLKLIIIMLF